MPPLPNIENILFLNDRTLTMHCDRYKQVALRHQAMLLAI